MHRPSTLCPRAIVRVFSLLLVCLGLVIAAEGCGGASGRTPTTAQTPAAAYQAGESVQVEWQGSWYAATVLAVLECEQYRIHYEGWGTEWDETVEVQRIRREGQVVPPPAELLTPHVVNDPWGLVENRGSQDDPGGSTPAADTPLPQGLRVHVAWRGLWFVAEILDAPAGSDMVRVHYVGWDAEWDEDVARDTIRVSVSAPSAQLRPQAKPAQSRAHPLGICAKVWVRGPCHLRTPTSYPLRRGD